MKTTDLARRNPSMDILRCLAFFLVTSVHFFLYSKFYDQTFDGARMHLMLLVRTLCMTCVPLFIMLSGFLLCNKKLSGRYYFGIVKTLCIYVLASVACMVYKHIHYNIGLSFTGVFREILAYTGANYSWYIEMYIGLFLLIPFLNLLYHAIPTQKQKLALLLTMLALTALPSILNIFNFNTEGWWAMPSLSNAYTKIVPAWWTTVYPLTYYFLGCYFREYRLDIPKSAHILLLAAATLLFGTFIFYRSVGAVFYWGRYQDWGSVGNTVLAVLLFTLVANTDFKKCPQWGKKLLHRLSDLCLGGFLLSFIFDSYYYELLNERVPDVLDRFYYFPLIVPAVYLSSLAGSLVLNLLYEGFYKGVHAIVRRVRLNTAEEKLPHNT